MKAAGDQFLAGAGLAEDQHIGRGVGHLKDQALNLFDRRGLAQQDRVDPLAVAQPAPQRLDFERQGTALERALNGIDQTFRRERLFDKS